MGNDDDELDDIVYKGVVPPDAEHESFFGSRGKNDRATHFTASENKRPRADDGD